MEELKAVEVPLCVSSWAAHVPGDGGTARQILHRGAHLTDPPIISPGASAAHLGRGGRVAPGP